MQKIFVPIIFLVIILLSTSFVFAQTINTSAFVELNQTIVLSLANNKESVEQEYQNSFDYFNNTGAQTPVKISFDIGDKPLENVVLVFRAHNSKTSKPIQLKEKKGNIEVYPKGLSYGESPHYAELLEKRTDGKYYRFAKSQNAIWLKASMVELRKDFSFTIDDTPNIRINFFVPKSEYASWDTSSGPALAFELFDNENNLAWKSNNYLIGDLKTKFSFKNGYGYFYLNDFFDIKNLTSKNSPYRLIMLEKDARPGFQQNPGYVLGETSSDLSIEAPTELVFVCPTENITKKDTISQTQVPPMVFEIKKEKTDGSTLSQPELNPIPEPTTIPQIESFFTKTTLQQTPPNADSKKKVFDNVVSVCNAEEIDATLAKPISLSENASSFSDQTIIQLDPATIIAPNTILSTAQLPPTITPTSIASLTTCKAIPLAELGKISITPKEKKLIPVEVIKTTPQECSSVLFWLKVLNRNILFQEN